MKTHSAAFDGTLNLGIWKSEDENQDQSEKPFSCTQGASKFTNPADLKMHENQTRHKTALNATLNPQRCWSEDTWKSGPI